MTGLNEIDCCELHAVGVLHVIEVPIKPGEKGELTDDWRHRRGKSQTVTEP